MQHKESDGIHQDQKPCELISWQGFHALARKLARQLCADRFRPDLIVAISRGGLMPARLLSDYLDVFDFDCLRVEHYHGLHKERLAQVRYPLSAGVTGKRVLMVDDVSDTGDTFDVAVNHLQQRGQPAQLKTCALHHKRVSRYIPDYFAEEVVEWRWIIYPWAVMEDLSSFLRDMPAVPPTLDQFAAYLRKTHRIEVSAQLLEEVFEFTGYPIHAQGA